MSADFWGLKTAVGTATAYHLLAAMLAKSHALEVGSDSWVQDPVVTNMFHLLAAILAKSHGCVCLSSTVQISTHDPVAKNAESP
jgi:hypothetical protein